MTHKQAAAILAILSAGYPHATFEHETAIFWTSQLAELADYETAQEAVDRIIKTSPKLPSIAEIRDAYSTIRRRGAETRGLPTGTAERQPPPEWVGVRLWASLSRNPRVEGAFPQEAEHAGNRRVLTDDEYQALRAEWVRAGSPLGFGLEAAPK